MSFTLPDGWTMDNVFHKIETHGKKGGQYPVGLYRLWHSGVHIVRGQEPTDRIRVSPMLNGTIVACRLSDSFATIPRIGRITKDTMSALSRAEQFLYGEPVNNIHELQYDGLNEDELADLSRRFNAAFPQEGDIRQWFKRSGDTYTAIEKVSTEYVLVRHEVGLPAPNANPDTPAPGAANHTRNSMVFYTLYMGLQTLVDEFREYYGNTFLPAQTSLAAISLPMFQRWVFQLRNTPDHPRRNFGGFSVFRYSACAFTSDAASPGMYLCHFTNDPNQNANRARIPVPVNLVRPMRNLSGSVVRDRVPVFRIPREENTPTLQTAQARAGVHFGLFKEWDRNRDYYEVIMWITSQHPSHLHGWIVNQNGRTGDEPFPLGDKTVFCIERLYSMPEGHLAIRIPLRTQIIKSLPHLGDAIQAVPVTVFARDDLSNDRRYSFYFNTVAIPQVQVSRRDFERLRDLSDDNRNASPSLRGGRNVTGLDAYEWTAHPEFEAGDMVVICTPPPYSARRPQATGFQRAPPIGQLPDFVINAESLSFCRFSFPPHDSTFEHNALIRRSDMSVSGGGGHLDEDKKAPGNFFTESANGCILYDTPRVNGVWGNARACLGASDTFEAREPRFLLENAGPGTDGEHWVTHGGREGVLRIGGTRTFLVTQIKRREGFAGDEGDVIQPAPGNAAVGRADVIGYPSPVPHGKKPFFDLALYFDDDSAGLFRETPWVDHPGTRTYVKPANFIGRFYRHNRATPGAYHFSANTMFDYTEADGTYRLTLRSFRMFVNGRFFNPEINLDTVLEQGQSLRLRETPPAEGSYFSFTPIARNALFREYYGQIGELLADGEFAWLQRGFRQDNPGIANNYHNIEIVIADLPTPLRLTAYARAGGTANLLLDEQNRTATVIDNGNVTLYAAHPQGSFEPAHPWGDAGAPAGDVELGRVVDTVRHAGLNAVFHGFRIGAGVFYARGEGEGPPEGLARENALDFPRHFEVMEGNEGGSIYIRNYYREIVGRLGGAEGDGFEWLMDIYCRCRPENMAKRATLRSIVCRHPFEWNRDLYDDGFMRIMGNHFLLDGERKTHLRAKMAAQDLWTGADGERVDIPELPMGNVWFAHPVYFVNHLDRAGLLDRSFNPYYGHQIKRTWTGLAEAIVVVRDNPGFAPTWIEHDNEHEGPIFTADEQPYAVPTGLFNQQYLNSRGSIYHHEGVDFRGSDGDNLRGNAEPTPIHALIDAEVIHVGRGAGEHRWYGCYMLLQSLRNKEHLYLLGHLSNTRHVMPQGSIVSPKDVVAYVGNTGNSVVAHLHVGFFKTSIENIFSRDTGLLEGNLFNLEYNPFDHDDPYELFR